MKHARSRLRSAIARLTMAEAALASAESGGDVAHHLELACADISAACGSATEGLAFVTSHVIQQERARRASLPPS